MFISRDIRESFEMEEGEGERVGKGAKVFCKNRLCWGEKSISSRSACETVVLGKGAMVRKKGSEKTLKKVVAGSLGSGKVGGVDRVVG